MVQLTGYNNKLIDVYLQEYTNIWTLHPDYKTVSMWNDDLESYAYLHHIDEPASISPDTFLSTEKNNLYDYKFIDKYDKVKFLHDGSFNLKLEMKKREYCLNDISDEIITLAPTFEIWFLMHFRNNKLRFQTSKDVKRELEKVNGTYSEIMDMYNRIKNQTDDARSTAQSIEQQIIKDGDDLLKSNPHSSVYKILDAIDEFNNLKD